jgi:uncharacterized protein (DUF2164 family)
MGNAAWLRIADGGGLCFGDGGKGGCVKGVELNKATKDAAVASIRRYFAENMAEEIGDLPAGLLLEFFVEEVGAVIYNKAIADAQTRMQLRVADLTGELFADEFGYWPRVEAKRKKR